jgi:hypothetical protein
MLVALPALNCKLQRGRFVGPTRTLENGLGPGLQEPLCHMHGAPVHGGNVQGQIAARVANSNHVGMQQLQQKFGHIIARTIRSRFRILLDGDVQGGLPKLVPERVAVRIFLDEHLQDASGSAGPDRHVQGERPVALLERQNRVVPS